MKCLRLNQPTPIAFFETQIDADDLINFLRRLSAAFSKDYFDKNSIEYGKAVLTFELAQKNKFSKDEFSKRLDEFLTNQKTDFWKPADFLSFDRPKLLTYQQAIQNDPTLKSFRAVKINGVSAVMWASYEIETLPNNMNFVNNI